MEEMLDTFDIDGNFLGSRSRSFCHSENPSCFHKPVWIWIVNDKNEILVQKRAHTKKKSPDKWDMPSAGHVDAGETMRGGCVRETKEELGLDVKEDDFIFLKEWLNRKGWELVQIYLLKTNAKESDFILQKEEVAEVKWMPYDEFIKLFYSPEFCNHAQEYKDYIAVILKPENLNKFFLNKQK